MRTLRANALATLASPDLLLAFAVPSRAGNVIVGRAIALGLRLAGAPG